MKLKPHFPNFSFFLRFPPSPLLLPSFSSLAAAASFSFLAISFCCVVRDHLICNGFVPRSDKLSDLGFNIQREETILDNDEGSIPNDSSDDVVRLLHDARDAFREGPNDEAKKFLRTKDHVSARRDLVELNLMLELQLRELEDGGEEFPRSRFWMSLEQKRRPIKGKGRTSKKKDREHILDHNQWVQAHCYVLFNCDCEEVEKYISEHKEFVSSRGKRKWKSVQDHSKDFVDWFREKVDFIVEEGQDIIPNNIIWLSKGPSYIAKKYTGYSVNGYRIHTMKRDANCVTQNSGVTLTAMTHSFASSKDQNPIEANVNYYGSITDTISISYHDYFCVVLFKCVWFHSEKDDDELMKGSKAKASDSQSQLPDYELQRLQKLKYNDERIQKDPYDGSSGDSDMEHDTLGIGKRQVSSQQHPVPTWEIQRKQQEQQLGSTKAHVKKRAFCSPGSIEMPEQGQNYDDEQLNETADALQEDCEGNEAADRAVVAQFGMEVWVVRAHICTTAMHNNKQTTNNAHQQTDQQQCTATNRPPAMHNITQQQQPQPPATK
uniref:Uncharacterized protein n=1 Tax=Chenopodium quinoa TaxID=63459 RepID=A0A803LW04_CHEQI